MNHPPTPHLRKRILIGSWSNAHVGGAETYIELLVHALHKSGYTVACIFERLAPENHQVIRLPEGVESWVGDLEAVRRWNPDCIYSHGYLDPEFERALQTIAYSVFFSHNYYGTCISGTKAWKRPARACSRVFGPACLAFYFSCGCGGLHPLRMIADFRLQYRRRLLLDGYQRILTASEAMTSELRRNVRCPERVRLLRLPLDSVEKMSVVGVKERLRDFDGSRPIRLIYVGRLEGNKGPFVAAGMARILSVQLRRAVELMFIGEGPERSRIESHAFDFRPAALRFTGWLSRDRLSCELEKADLLVVPSLWPEPFGLVGLEAALKGVPAVGFAHGGIVDWLKDGTTGGLANAEPPTSESLAEAALRCLTSKEVFERLSLDSLDFATAWPGIDRHVVDLMQLIAHSTSP